MITEIIEIEAMSIEEAKKRAMKILDIQKDQILKIDEKRKSKSFFGFFAKEGLYTIEYTREEIKKEKANSFQKTHFGVRRDLRKEQEEKDKSENFSTQEQDILKIIDKENKKFEIIKKCEELLQNMGLNLKVAYLENNEKIHTINLSGEDKGIIIGKKGKTLNSFEYLMNSLIRDARVEVDVEGFKEKRKETLKELANKMAIKAIKTKRVVRLNPMPPRERKIIHEIVNNYPELNTFSEGKDPKRYIVIKRKKETK